MRLRSKHNEEVEFGFKPSGFVSSTPFASVGGGNDARWWPDLMVSYGAEGDGRGRGEREEKEKKNEIDKIAPKIRVTCTSHVIFDKIWMKI